MVGVCGNAVAPKPKPPPTPKLLSAAAAAGIQAGDVLLRFGADAVHTFADLEAQMARRGAGEKLKI